MDEPDTSMHDNMVWQVLPFRTVMSNGLTISVREILPRDRAAVAAGHDALSEKSRRMRYLSSHHKLSDLELDNIVGSDGIIRMALGAEIENEDNAPSPAAVSRLVRSAGDLQEAEMAVTVADAYHGLGIGVLMLGILAKQAAWSGIDRFQSLVSSDNVPMLHVLEGLGSTRSEVVLGEYKVTTPLHRDAENYPDTRTGARFRKAYELATLLPRTPEQALR